MIVTTDPFPRVTNTVPPGLSRMNAPPPSEARMIARIGVGSAVTAEVDVSVGARVTLVRVGWGLCEGALVEASLAIVAWLGRGVAVILGIGDRVDVAAIRAAGSGVGEARPVLSRIQLPKPVYETTMAMSARRVNAVKVIP